MPKETPMDREAADRIAAAADRDPQSPTATSGFDERAAAATRNEQDESDQHDQDRKE